MKVELRGKGYIHDYVSSCYPFTDRGDLIICIGDSHIYTTRELVNHNIINVHTSLLPYYKGRHPIVWAIINGEKETGITIHYMSTGIDEGDIILQDSIPITLEDDYPSVLKRCAALVYKMIPVAIEQLQLGIVYRRKQGPGTYLPRRYPENSKIDWSKRPEEIINFIRALHDPMPNAYTIIEGRKVCLKIASVSEMSTNNTGKI